MNMRFNFDESFSPSARMKVVGVGGGGCNAVNRMIEANLSGVEFISVNTDLQALEHAKSSGRVQIGKGITRGLGAGADPEIGRRAVEEDREAVIESLSDSDMVFIAGGMGGGTGTGAAPVVAEIAKDLGALTVGIVTKPFIFEGPKRLRRAEEGIMELKEQVDTLIVIPNQRLLSVVPKGTPLTAAFRTADEVLLHATKGISDLISIPGLINLDFADVRTVMREMGDALMGSAVSSGETRSVEAAQKAIASPLLDDISIEGAQGVLVNITGGDSLALHEVNDATMVISEAAGEEANLIFGAVVDTQMEEEIRVTVIATGFNKNPADRALKSLQNLRLIDTEMSDLEVPAYQRRTTNGNGAPATSPPSYNQYNGNGARNKSAAKETLSEIEQTLYSQDDDDLESPAYIRKRWRK